MPRRDLEGPIHRQIVSYLRHVLPPDSIIHHSRNEGNRGGIRGKLDGARGKAMGVLPGFPDLLIYTGEQGYCLEVKTPKGRLSEAQKDVKERLERQALPYAVVRSVEDTRAALAEWGVQTREVVAE